jgi:mitochondrial distribution and morphology protein 10
VSTGIRFSTLPDATPPSYHIPANSSSPLASSSSLRTLPSQPPTTITALFNPMLGHLSGAYSARVSRDLSLSSRFDFNVYSYESEWTMGTEYWLRRRPSEDLDDGSQRLSSTSIEEETKREIHGVFKARASTSNVRSVFYVYGLTLSSLIQNVSIMWEGRIRSMLVSLGVVSDFSNRLKPIKAVGVELSYFSSE